MRCVAVEYHDCVGEWHAVMDEHAPEEEWLMFQDFVHCRRCRRDPREEECCEWDITQAVENLLHNLSVVVALAAAAQEAIAEERRFWKDYTGIDFTDQ